MKGDVNGVVRHKSMSRVPARIQVSNPPSTPVLVYDGSCSFCVRQVEHWKQRLGDTVAFLPWRATGLKDRFPEIPESCFERALQLIDTDGRVYPGAHGALKALSIGGHSSWLLRLYEGTRAGSIAIDWAYRLIATHRWAWSQRPGRTSREA